MPATRGRCLVSTAYSTKLPANVLEQSLSTAKSAKARLQNRRAFAAPRRLKLDTDCLFSAKKSNPPTASLVSVNDNGFSRYVRTQRWPDELRKQLRHRLSVLMSWPFRGAGDAPWRRDSLDISGSPDPRRMNSVAAVQNLDMHDQTLVPAMQQIADWLKELGMSEYTDRFVENRIDISVLPDLTDEDWKNWVLYSAIGAK